MAKFGLLGEKLGHSYSPAIHSMLASYEYRLYQVSREDLDSFMREGDWDGLNVTIPYKKAVVPYCSKLSQKAAALGSVNTLVRLPDGGLYGDNTDAYGFEKLLHRAGIDVSGKKALVLGSGGASVTVCAVLESMGAAQVIVISRDGENNYKNLSRHADAGIIVNATPVGMYPNNGKAAVDLSLFPQCQGVLDVVYNPARTALILQAERLGIPCASGLYMLVAQAKRSSELFTQTEIDDGEIDRIQQALSSGMLNIVFVGMPGSGKSSLAQVLGQRLNRPVLESDQRIEELAGMSIPEIFERFGEDRFRDYETQALTELSKQSGAVISTGGGCVKRPDNYPLLHQNGTIVWLQRDIDKLPKDGRPISQKSDLQQLYQQRKPLYESFADLAVDNNGSLEETVQTVMQALGL